MRKVIKKQGLVLFTFILILSLLISSLLFVCQIDPDFFDYYYVGRGISRGQDMFRDFANNKGPIFYFFMAGLYKLFGRNYYLAVFFANGFVDAVALFFLCRLLEKWRLFTFSTKEKDSYFKLLFIVAYYKSFSLGIGMGGFYTETLAFCLIIISLFFQEKDHDLGAGISFALACLCRPTVVFFFLFLLVKYFLKKQPKRLIIFVLSGLSVGLITLAYFFMKGTLVYLINNFILYNFHYAAAVSKVHLYSIIYISTAETRILLSLVIFTVFLINLLLKIDFRNKDTLVFFVLVICSLLSTFTGGVFYYHHFLQCALAFLVCWFLLFKKDLRPLFFQQFNLMLIVCLLVNYLYSYRSEFRLSKEAEIFLEKYLGESQPRKYLFAFFYWPKYYFQFDREAPDRYYQSFSLMDEYNGNASFDRSWHLKADKNKIKNTTFLFVSISDFEQSLNAEYLKYFQKDFGLKKIDSFSEGVLEMKIYYADPKI